MSLYSRPAVQCICTVRAAACAKYSTCAIARIIDKHALHALWPTVHYNYNIIIVNKINGSIKSQDISYTNTMAACMAIKC